MKPVFQTKFGKPEGNCHAACLASIFEIDIDSIPDFGHDNYWFDRFVKWCQEEFDLTPIDIEIEHLKSTTWWRALGYCIINGPSINGDYWHSVVGWNGEIAHDPHPNTPALKEPRTYTLFVSSLRND